MPGQFSVPCCTPCGPRQDAVIWIRLTVGSRSRTTCLARSDSCGTYAAHWSASSCCGSGMGTSSVHGLTMLWQRSMQRNGDGGQRSMLWRTNALAPIVTMHNHSPHRSCAGWCRPWMSPTPPGRPAGQGKERVERHPHRRSYMRGARCACCCMGRRTFWRPILCSVSSTASCDFKGEPAHTQQDEWAWLRR